MDVYADTAAAEQKLDDLSNTRYATLQIRVAEVNVLRRPRSARGRVDRRRASTPAGASPARDPGFDNVLWPLNTGGRTLMQPLAGGEFVMNSKDAAYWGPLLDWMNGGGRPVQTFNETSQRPRLHRQGGRVDDRRGGA